MSTDRKSIPHSKINNQLKKHYSIFTFANKFSCSFKYLEDNIAATITLIAPRGVTTEAGAKA